MESWYFPTRIPGGVLVTRIPGIPGGVLVLSTRIPGIPGAFTRDSEEVYENL